MGWLDGKVALVTGGGSGIGRAVVKRFVEEGAKVGVMDLSESRLQEVKEELADEVVTITGDVRDYADHEQAVKQTVEAFGRLDCLVANAGVFDGFVPLEKVEPEILDKAYEELFSVNVKGNFFAAKAALPELIKNKGTIIFSLSGASFYPDGGGTLYTASKHAVLGLLRQLAFELAPDVRVNGVAPGGTITKLTSVPSLRPYVQAISDEQRKAKIQKRNPMRMYMVPEDHVASYVLLASDQAPAITGDVIETDGGLSVRGLS